MSDIGHYVIKLIVPNPKRGKSRERYTVYDQAATIGRMIDIYTERGYVKSGCPTPRRLAMADLRWDLAHGFIKIFKPALEEVTKL